MGERILGTTAGNRELEDGSNRNNKGAVGEENKGFKITKKSDIDRGSKTVRYNNNIEAIKLIKTLKEENRQATKSEAEILAKYTGWGGIKEAFIDNKDSKWQDRANEIKSILTKEEYNAARESTDDAFYTPLSVVFSMYDIIKHLGVKGGSILEPSCGTGYFIGAMPANIKKNSHIMGIELDGITGSIAKQLYPNANIQVKGFQDTNIVPNSLDLVIGNVPFGSSKLYDKQYKQYGKYNIHDYFILKSLDSLKDGGIMAVLTTSGTMDKADTEVRKLMDSKANLIGAIRLPSGTFGATDVVTDLIIMQKQSDGVRGDNDFISTKDYKGVQVNEYFLNYPEMVLGDFSIEINQYGKLFANVKANDRSIADVIDKLPKNIVIKSTQEISEKLSNETIDTLREQEAELTPGDLLVKNGMVMRMNDSGIPVPWYKTIKSGPNKGKKTLYKQDGKEAERVRGMLDLSLAMGNVINTQIKTENPTELKKAQAKLNKVYDEFKSKHGAISDKANKAVFVSDDRYYKLASIEESKYIDGKKEYVKGAIFSERTIPVNNPITSVDNVNDALTLSLNMANGVSLDYMSELYGKDKETIVRELGERIYELPGSEGNYVSSEEYLSGNVKEKLKAAEAKAKDNPRFEKNIDALKKVQPVDLKAEEISVVLGTPWVGTENMQAFVNHLMNQENGGKAYYNPYNSSWTFENYGNYYNESTANNKWGTKDYSVLKLLDAIANKKPITVIVKDGDSTVMHYDRTMMARAKAEELKDYFADWIYKDSTRRKQLEDYYNEHFNNLVTRSYDGSHLSMYGSNPIIKLRPHQASAVARAISGNTLMAHPVGAGKTYAMIGSVMEMKRLGIAQKPIMVVPNHKLGDFMTDFYKMYPNAKLLTVRTEDFNRENRKKMLAKIQTTNFDCIIMRHSSFESFGFSAEYEQAYVQNQIVELEEAIRAGKEGNMDKRGLSNMNQALKALKEKLKKELDRPKDSEAYFDTCGIDALIVDEAHNFKNLAFNTKMSRIAGVQNSKSERARHMHMATEFMNKNDKRIVFATATPVSNSIGELYSMIRYMRPDILEKYQIKSFDAWADTFGEIISSVEMNTTGSGVRTKERFAKFKNVPELIKMFKTFADIVDKSDLDLNLPNPTWKHETVDSSEILNKYNHELEKNKKNMSQDEAKKGGHLVLMQDARMAALDLRCVKRMLIENGLVDSDITMAELDLLNSKVNKAVSNILNEYKASYENKGTQIVFLDRGTPVKQSKTYLAEINILLAKDENELTPFELAKLDEYDNSRRYSFDLYNDIKQKLIAGGIKGSEIAFIQDTAGGKSDEKKSELFDKVNAGEVRVLLGSTSMMGEGMNAQKKAVALHQIDAPMRPSDVEQREGRVLRQGNENDNVRLYHYSTLNSYDAPTWEMLARKNKAITQIMKGDETIREIEDMNDDMFANMSIEAANNPLMFERKDVDDKLKKLQYKKKNFQSEQYNNQYIIESYPGKIKTAEDKSKVLKAVQGVLDKGNKSAVVNGVTHEKMIEASVALKDFVKTLSANKEKVPCGSLRGLNLVVQKTSSVDYNVQFEQPIAKAEATMGLEDGGYESENKTDTVFLRLNNRLNDVSNKITYNANSVEGMKQILSEAKENVNATFAYDEDISSLKRRLLEIDSELNNATKSKPESKSESAVQVKKELSMQGRPEKKGNTLIEKLMKPEVQDKLSKMPPVAIMTGEEFAKSEKSLSKMVSEYFESIGGEVQRKSFGTVLLNNRGIKDSMAHGIGRKKSAAFKAVPNVVKYGVQIDYQTNWKDRLYDTYIFAAPVTINKSVHNMGVVVIRKEDSNRFYLHEVIEIKNDGIESFKTRDLNYTVEALPGDSIPSDGRAETFWTGDTTSGLLPGESAPPDISILSNGEKYVKNEKFSLMENTAGFYQPTGKTYDVVKNIDIQEPKKGQTPYSIITDMAKELHISATSKRFRRPNRVKGFFIPSHMQVRIRDLNELEPAMHEFGHLFDEKYKFTDEYRNEFTNMLAKAPGIKDEMEARGYKEEDMHSEVMADFMLLYMTNPDGAYELGSFAGKENFYDIFENTLSDADKKLVQKYRNKVLSWRGLSHIEKTQRTMHSVFEKAPINLDDVKQSTMEWLFDRDNAFKDVGAKIQDEAGVNIPAANDPYLKAMFARTSSRLSSSIITESLRDKNGNVCGQSMLSVISDLYGSNAKVNRQRELDFNTYLRDLHSLDWMEQGKKTFNSDMQDKSEIESAIAHLDKENPDFKVIAQNLYDWWADFTDIWLVESGLADKKLMDSLREKYPHYVPTFRVQRGKNGKKLSITSDGFNNMQNPLKRASEKGSTAETYLPLESMMKEVERYVEIATKRDVMLSLHNLYGQHGTKTEFTDTISQFMVKVPPEMQKSVFDATGLKANLSAGFLQEAKAKMSEAERTEFESKSILDQIQTANEMGYDNVIDSIINDTIVYYTPKKISTDKEVATVTVNGKTYFYFITDTHLARAISGLNGKQIPTALRTFKALFTNTFSMLTTSANVLFILPNFARDLQQGITASTSKYGALDPRLYASYTKDVALAINDVLTHSEAHKLYQATGGFGAKLMHDRNSLEKAMRKTLPSCNKGVVNRAKRLADGVEYLNSVFEEANRLVEFKRVLKDTGDVQQASYAAKDVTGNFSRSGYLVDYVGAFIPFINAGMAGIDKARRMALTKEGRKGGLKSQLAKSIAMYGMLAVITVLAYSDDDDYQSLPDYVKDNYYLIKYGPGKFIRIPKNRELAALFNTTLERAINEIKHPEDGNGKATLAAIMQNWFPPHDCIWKPFYDAALNRTWSGGTILNTNEKTIADGGYYDEVYDDTTSVLAVWLAKALPDIAAWGALNTPKGIEYIMKQQLGFISQLGLPYTRPANDGITSAITQKFTTDTTYTNRWQNDFYSTYTHLQAWDKLNEYEKDNVDFKDLPPEAQWRKMYSKVADELTDLRKEIKEINADKSLDREERVLKARNVRQKINTLTENIQKQYVEATSDGNTNAPSLTADESAYKYDMDKQHKEKYDTEVKQFGISESDYFNVWKAQKGENKTDFERAINIISTADEKDIESYQQVFKISKSNMLKAKDAKAVDVTPDMITEAKEKADLMLSESEKSYNNGSITQEEADKYLATRSDLNYEQKQVIKAVLCPSLKAVKNRYPND
ncbi:MAG: LPD38 domain-containing protein [Aminipila sp.]